MKIKCSYKELKDPVTLTPHPRNPNRHPDRQIELLRRVIDHHGWRHPIIVSNRSGFIVAGHGRLQAAIAMGATQVPVDYQDFQSEADEFQFLVADNKISDLASLDDAFTIEQIQSLELVDTDFELMGFDDFKIELGEPEIKEDKVNAKDDTQFLIIIECKDELEQADLFSEFETRKLKCKLMS